MSTAAVTLNDVTAFGRGLHRPECVLPAPNGDVYVPDWRGGVSVVRADGSVETWLAKDPGIDLKPNGIAFLPGGDFLIANLGNEGGVWRMNRQGVLSPFLAHLDGAPLPPANFVYLDNQARIWITVSTRKLPRQDAWRDDVTDGFIVLVDQRGARIVADGLHYTNEARADPAGRFLFVVETFGRRLLRYPIKPHGDLGSPEIAVQLGAGYLPDGFAFDEAGGIWITSLVSNRILRADADGEIETVIADTNDAFVASMEDAYARRKMRAEHLGPIPDTRFQHLTSIGFGGANRRTAFLGSLHADCVYRFPVQIPGAAQPYWAFPLP